MANPQTLLYSFSPQATQYGGLITSTAAYPVYNDICPGVYSSFDITFMDQTLTPMTTILDPNICITLVIREKGEQ